MEIENRTFLVTGGGSGLGGATAAALSAHGATVVVADLKGDAPAGGHFVTTDVTDEQQVAAAIEVATSQAATFGGAVNCAGIAVATKILGKSGPHDLALFQKVATVNLAGTFNVLRLAAAALQGNEPGPSGERGVIVNTASAAAYDGQVGQAAYASSKAGVVGLTLPAARELAGVGVRVVAIAPGLFMTPMMSDLPADAIASLGAHVPFPSRLGEPEEYAALVCHVVENQMLNGETIRIDGALRMAPR